uniref:Uncharacterized protein n=1 Tax=Romanomermis culicivorax TaxID=13658 RepID=A0A915L640_ROMCU
ASKRQVRFEENDVGYLSDCQCSNSNVLRHYHQYQEEEEIVRMTSVKNISPTMAMKESPSNDIQISLSLSPDSAANSNQQTSPKLDSFIEWIRTGPLKSKRSSIREAKSPQRRTNFLGFDTLDRRRASVDPTLLMDTKSHSHEGSGRYHNPFNSILRRDKQKRNVKNEIQYHSTGCVNIRPSTLTLNRPLVCNGNVCNCGVDKLSSSSFANVGRTNMNNSQDLRRAAAIGSMMSRSLLGNEELVGTESVAETVATAASRLQQRRSTLSAETLTANQARARSGSTESGVLCSSSHACCRHTSAG